MEEGVEGADFGVAGICAVEMLRGRWNKPAYVRVSLWIFSERKAAAALMKPCSRKLVERSFCASRFLAALFQSLVIWKNPRVDETEPIALPQCAMAHFGSRVGRVAKVFSVPRIGIECRSGDALSDR